MIPHYNYFPPAGQVIDATDGRVQWNGQAWVLSGRVYGVPSSHQLVGRPGGPLSGWHYDWNSHAWMEPSPQATTQPVVYQHPVPAVHHIPTERKEHAMDKRPNALESLIQHPVAPVIGGLLLVAAHFTDEPVPPQITDDLPETVAKQWQMIFNQNQQRFARRMTAYENLGMVLLGYAGANTILDALPSKR